MADSGDVEALKSGAVSGLHQALIAGQGVPEAVRRCCYEHPAFFSALFTEAVRRWFRADGDLREITAFVTWVAAAQDAGDLWFPRREAEAVIRAVLGEVAYFDYVHPGQFSYAEIAVAVLSGLFAEHRPNAEEAGRLLVNAEQAVAVGLEAVPGAAAVEEEWFREGMHLSPFAVPMTVVSHDRREGD